MLAAGFINTIMISAIKQLAVDLHAFEIAFFRCMIGFVVLLPVVWQAGGASVLRTQHMGLHLLRGVLNAGGMLLFFWAVSLAPLATVSAIGFASPLFAALLAILFLGERVGLRRWSGLIVGFIGTVVILRPGYDIVDFGAVIALVNMLAFAGMILGNFGCTWLANAGLDSAGILLAVAIVTFVATVWAIWLLPDALLRLIIVMVAHTLYRVRILGAEKMPKEGGAMLVPNHVSFLDCLFLLAATDRPIRFVVGRRDGVNVPRNFGIRSSWPCRARSTLRCG